MSGVQALPEVYREDVLSWVRFPEVEFTNATLCAVVQFMADEWQRQSTGQPDWPPPHFTIEVAARKIDIRPTPRGKPLPKYEFDSIKNPRFSLRIKESITLRKLLDAVCEKTGFQWEAEARYVRIFKQS